VKCQNVQKLLPLFSGGDLRGLRRNRIRLHIERCESCRKDLVRFQKTREWAGQAIRQKELSISHDSCWEQILYKLPRNATKRSKTAAEKKYSPFHRIVPLLIGAAAILIMLLMGDVGPFINRRTEQPEPIVRNLPVVENVNKPGVTVMTFQTDDPRVTIVWFFEEESNQSSGGQNETST
jgi:hypothetical protein